MGADCKDSLPDSSTPCENGVRLRCIAYTPVSNITLTRRQNALALFQDYAEKALASGAAPKGLEQSFAASLQISPSMWSQIKSSRPIGDNETTAGRKRNRRVDLVLHKEMHADSAATGGSGK